MFNRRIKKMKKRHSLVSVLIIFLTLLTKPSLSYEKEPDFKEIISLEFPLAPLISPDGKSVLYSVEVTDWKDNSFKTKLVNEMERRDTAKRSSPAIVTVIDELAELRMVNGKVVEETLTRLTQRGRESGIHVILATQRPASTVVGGLVKANLPVRLVGAVGSPEDAKVATGIAGSNAERLQGRGDFLLVSHGDAIRFQAAYVREEDGRKLVDSLRLRR